MKNQRNFYLKSPFSPAGDQPQAIQELTEGVLEGKTSQVLLGVTGSGKTYTMANVIKKTERPTLVLTHNKMLANQLYQEFKNFFPHNRVEYYTSHYDVFVPENYDSENEEFKEKKKKVNKKLTQLKHRAISSMISGRRDVIVIASVSCIYGCSNPEDYKKNLKWLKVGDEIRKRDITTYLKNGGYAEGVTGSNESAVFMESRNHLHVRMPYVENSVYDIYFKDGKVDTIMEEGYGEVEEIMLHHVDMIDLYEKIPKVYPRIKKEYDRRLKHFQSKHSLQEAENLEKIVGRDLVSMKEGNLPDSYENYSWYFDGRTTATQQPYTLLDYFPEDFITIVDESHVTVPLLKTMYRSDKARKEKLVEYGCRLPSAMRSRALDFVEIMKTVKQRIFVSATPSDYEVLESDCEVVEQVIRPTRLMDPVIKVEPNDTPWCRKNIRYEINEAINRNERVFILCVSKLQANMAEIIMTRRGYKCCSMDHTMTFDSRGELMEDFKKGEYDVMIGINLIREGIDIPQASLMLILDADRGGIFRGRKALFQMAGRVSRNPNGKVILFADKINNPIRELIEETKRRRRKQKEYNNMVKERYECKESQRSVSKHGKRKT